MSSRKVMQAPETRREGPTSRRTNLQVRGFWEWLIGGYWRGG